MRPPQRSRASRMVTFLPARASSRAAIRPAAPAPTIKTWFGDRTAIAHQDRLPRWRLRGQRAAKIAANGVAAMRIEGHRIGWEAHDEPALEAILRRRDGRGGALFWLSDEARSFPCLALRVSGDSSDIHYFPHEEHAGFRCLGGQDLPPGGTTTLVYE